MKKKVETFYDFHMNEEKLMKELMIQVKKNTPVEKKQELIERHKVFVDMSMLMVEIEDSQQELGFLLNKVEGYRTSWLKVTYAAVSAFVVEFVKGYQSSIFLEIQRLLVRLKRLNLEKVSLKMKYEAFLC